MGTHEIFRLASHLKPKIVHYISTLSVFPMEDELPLLPIEESDQLDFDKLLITGYAQSKWVSEKMALLARSRGLCVNIYRLGRITGHSQTGAWNTEDLVCRMIKGCIQLGMAPMIATKIDLTPVDYTCDALINISMQKEGLGKTYHLIHPNPISFNKLIDYLNFCGYPIEQVSYAKWSKALLVTAQKGTANALHPLLDLFSPSNEKNITENHSPLFLAENTEKMLSGSKIHCATAEELLPVYINYLKKIGYLPN